jgi:xylose isomerase-like TIM barrel protein
MRRRTVLASMAALALPGRAALAAGDYYTGDYKVSLNLYSFNLNLNAWVKGRKGAPPIDTVAAVKWAKQAGFDAVDVTAYYIPGYENDTMPSQPRADILAYVQQVRATARQQGVDISGTGIQNDFADPDAAKRALDVQRGKFWIDMAAEMGAPVMRVFSGLVPADIEQLGWLRITHDRVVPALRQLADYGAAKGVRIGLQNHGDMTATADQIIMMTSMVESPNIGIIDDTGYFRPFRGDTGVGYDWYTDIRKVLPFACNFQVKRKPAGAEDATLMDFTRLFTDVRSSPYRGYIPLERLWVKDDPGYPRDLKTPPFDQVSAFLGEVRTALQQTKAGPR